MWNILLKTIEGAEGSHERQEGTPWSERHKGLNVLSLSKRRLRGDLISVYRFPQMGLMLGTEGLFSAVEKDMTRNIKPDNFKAEITHTF